MLVNSKIVNGALLHGSYMCTFLKTGRIPAGHEEMNAAHGQRLWRTALQSMPSLESDTDEFHMEPRDVINLVVYTPANFVSKLSFENCQLIAEMLRHFQCNTEASELVEFHSKMHSQVEETVAKLFRSSSLSWTKHGNSPRMVVHLQKVISSNLEIFECTSTNETHYARQVLNSPAFRRRWSILCTLLDRRGCEPYLDVTGLKADVMAFGLFIRCCKGTVSDFAIAGDTIRDGFLELGNLDEVKRCWAQALSASPEAGIELPERPPKRLRGASLAIEDTNTLLRDMIQTATGLSGTALKAFTMTVSDKFIELQGREEPNATTAELKRKYKTGSHGLNTVITEACKHIAEAAILHCQGLHQAIPCHPLPNRSEFSLPRNNSSTGFSATGDHAIAKDEANHLWIGLIKGATPGLDGNVMFIDHWENSVGFSLRTTKALLKAGVKTTSMFSANRDEGIARELAEVGINTHFGEWRHALESWTGRTYIGIYLDLCQGSAGYMIDQLEAIQVYAANNCVLGYTIVHRDYEGTPLLMRMLTIMQLLTKRGWRAAHNDFSAATRYHHSSAGQPVLTQFWVYSGHISM
jgi:hypothetical protein